MGERYRRIPLPVAICGAIFRIQFRGCVLLGELSLRWCSFNVALLLLLLFGS